MYENVEDIIIGLVFLQLKYVYKWFINNKMLNNMFCGLGLNLLESYIIINIKRLLLLLRY